MSTAVTITQIAKQTVQFATNYPTFLPVTRPGEGIIGEYLSFLTTFKDKQYIELGR